MSICNKTTINISFEISIEEDQVEELYNIFRSDSFNFDRFEKIISFKNKKYVPLEWSRQKLDDFVMINTINLIAL